MELIALQGQGAKLQASKSGERPNAQCRSCQTSYEPFHSFGRMPIANGFLRRDEIPNERFFELSVGACPKCQMVQLIDQPPPEWMFHDDYAFHSSTSERMKSHFRGLAQKVIEQELDGDDPFVVEIGCNDGILLANFAQAGIRHLGIEPASNVAQHAKQRGIRVLTAFFDGSVAHRIRQSDGQADAILAANVMCHIPDLHSVVEGIASLLRPGGIFLFEDPYLPDILEKTSYDQIYDEHVFYFSVTSLAPLFNKHGLEIIDVEPQPVHGGSMRYHVAHRRQREPSPRVRQQLAYEHQIGIGKPETYQRLSRRIDASRRSLVALVDQIRRGGGRIVGYGATSKSTTVTNYCTLGPDLIEFISDTTPIKQGKVSPGTHIPVRPHEAFQNNPPDYALLFAWNHTEEILEKEQAFTDGGGRWIVYVPSVRVLP